jgi:hypothetical protein
MQSPGRCPTPRVVRVRGCRIRSAPPRLPPVASAVGSGFGSLATAPSNLSLSDDSASYAILPNLVYRPRKTARIHRPDPSGCGDGHRGPALILYLDISALIKVFVNEAGHELVVRAVKESSKISTSMISYAEARATFARLLRKERLTKNDLTGAPNAPLR